MFRLHRRRLSWCTRCKCTQQNSAALFFVTLFYTPFSFLQDNNIKVGGTNTVELLGSAMTRWGSLQHSPRPHSWIQMGGRFATRGGRGREGRGEGRGLRIALVFALHPAEKVKVGANVRPKTNPNCNMTDKYLPPTGFKSWDSVLFHWFLLELNRLFFKVNYVAVEPHMYSQSLFTCCSIVSVHLSWNINQLKSLSQLFLLALACGLICFSIRCHWLFVVTLLMLKIRVYYRNYIFL